MSIIAARAVLIQDYFGSNPDLILILYLNINIIFKSNTLAYLINPNPAGIQ